MNQLPAHLQNYEKRGLLDRATAGMGGSLPAHISTQGGQFAFVDTSGNRNLIVSQVMVNGMPLNTAQKMRCIVIDISEVMCKSIYEGDWKPGASDAPMCWSSNGIGPSANSQKPQSRTCADCEYNRRGSDTTLKGKPTKACRDEKYLALIVPGVGHPVRLVLTPTSFKNWGAYVDRFRGQPIDFAAVITTIGFVEGENQQLSFTCEEGDYIDAASFNAVQQLLKAGSTDLYCGRLDKVAQLPGPGPSEIDPTTGQLYGPTRGLPTAAPSPAAAPPVAPPATFGVLTSPGSGYVASAVTPTPPERIEFAPMPPMPAPVSPEFTQIAGAKAAEAEAEAHAASLRAARLRAIEAASVPQLGVTPTLTIPPGAPPGWALDTSTNQWVQLPGAPPPTANATPQAPGEGRATRRRRSKGPEVPAEVAAPQQLTLPGTPPAGFTPGAPPAGFTIAQAPPQPAGTTPPPSTGEVFGMAQGATPTAELASTISSFFGPTPPAS